MNDVSMSDGADRAPLALEEYQRAAELRAAIRGFLRHAERVSRSRGLTPQRHLLLLMIKGAEDGSQQSTVTALARRMQLAQSTVTELVNRAERVGLLEREQAAYDGRVTHLRLTPLGEERLAEVVRTLGPERQRLGMAVGELIAPEGVGSEV